MSEKSSLLDEEEFIKKRRNERFAYILGIFTQFVWSVNGLQLKSIFSSFPECYSLNSIIFWRCLPVIVISYYTCYYKNIPITPHREIKHIVWFYFRSLGNYFFVLLNITVLSYFRLSTSRVFLSCQPLVTIFLSIIFLSETFHFRYLFGILIGLLGSSIIALNDKKPQSRSTIVNDNMAEGLVYAVLLLTVMALASVGQKMITKDGMPVQVQNFYLGVYNGLPGFIMCLYERHFALKNFKYVIYCISNGFVFLAGHYLTTICYQYIAISKFLPVTYLVVVFTFFLSVTVLREPLFFTDILGAGIIIGFQFYNLMYPPKRNNLNVNGNSNKEKFLNELDKENRNSDIYVINRISVGSIIGKD